MALRMHPSLTVHVGDWLKTEIVEPAGVSVTALAEHFGVSRQALSTLLNGNANLSADMAIRIGLLTNTTPESWLGGQAKRDLWLASQKPRPAVEPFRLAA